MDDIEVIAAGKISEQGLLIKLPLKNSAFFFGAASCRFTRDNAGWQAAEETIEILGTAVEALAGQAGSNSGPDS